ncbi:MAG: molybdate ABC transporter substrate-binding protein, partial [Acidobacteriota bacterium]
MRSCALLAFFALSAFACGDPADREPRAAPLVIFAAASLRDVAVDWTDDFRREHPVEAVFNFAGSNTLAQQIRAAPRADVFLSADERWIDFLVEAERTAGEPRRRVLSNRLVVVAHQEAELEIGEPGDLATSDYRFLALADPQAVPAGRYAKTALEHLPAQGGSLWSTVSPRLATALDVRAALALVASDPRIIGIVYRTDAATSSDVRVLFELPQPSDQPISYSAA